MLTNLNHLLEVHVSYLCIESCSSTAISHGTSCDGWAI